MERDKHAVPTKDKITDFNSHAHVERDYRPEMSNDYLNISTHTLTWSVTNYYGMTDKQEVISTHTLTWSVTGTAMTKIMAKYFNSHAHVERDGQGG